jgi:hypothetical protein
LEDTNIAAITLYKRKGLEKAESLPWMLADDDYRAIAEATF